MESAPADLPPGVATSVDVSGKGDPCSFKGKDYSISWYYDKDSTKVTFEYVQPVKQGKWWSAIGIGDNMNDMDIGIIYLNDGNVVDIIDHYSSDYVPPVKDESQDWGIVNSSKSAVDGKAKYVVSRKINTGDDKKDKTMDGCVLFQFGVNLAEYVIKDNNLKIKKHNDWPDLYKACDLKERCLKQNDKVLASTDEKPVSEAKVNIASMGPILPATKCKSSGNTYSSHWYYIKQNDTVEFVLNYQVVPGKSWSTITFGSSPKRDAFMIFVDDKKIIDLGDFVLKNFQETKKDKLQDWNIVYSNVDEKTNFVKVKMSRALVTADKKRDRPFDTCVNIQFGINMGTYEYKDGNYHLTKVNEPAESVQMCNMRDVCVTDYGDEIAKDAAPEVNEKSENELNGGSQGVEPIIPEGEDEIIQVKKRVEESSPNSVNETTTLANVNSTTTIANVESTTVLITVESTTLNIDNTTKLIDQTTTTVSNENVSSSSPSNIPESENEENNSTPLVSKNTTEILSELGSGVEVTSKPNEDTSTIQITTDTTSKSNLEELKKDEPINFSTTEGTSNSTTPENITGSTPTLSSELETTTSSVINNQETTTSSISSTTTSAELDTSSEVSINSKLNLNVTTNNTSLNSNESKEFDNSNENNNNNNDNTSSIKLQDTTTSQILSSTTTDIPTTTTTLNGGEQTLTTTIVPGESLTTTTVTVESTTTTNNDNNTTTSLDSINTSTPQTINKFLESHESNNSKENKDAINQLKNDNSEKANTCSPTHKDLYICESYMNEYLNRVDTWAKQRGETLDNQLWKACSLLKKVPHVPTLCCQIFNFKCGSHITAPPPSTTISTLV